MSSTMIYLNDDGAFAGEVESGTVAYADAEWVRKGAPIPALVYSPAGSFRWAGDRGRRLRAGTNPDIVAAQLLHGVAKRAAAVVRDTEVGSVEVTGDGVVARATADLLAPANSRSDRPQAIIDTTGDPSVLLTCTRRLADGGTLVLAGAHTVRITLDLYPDVHVRGLRLRGVESPHPNGADVGHAVPAVFGETVARISQGEPPSGAGWYRVQF